MVGNSLEPRTHRNQNQGQSEVILQLLLEGNFFSLSPLSCEFVAFVSSFKWFISICKIQTIYHWRSTDLHRLLNDHRLRPFLKTVLTHWHLVTVIFVLTLLSLCWTFKRIAHVMEFFLLRLFMETSLYVVHLQKYHPWEWWAWNCQRWNQPMVQARRVGWLCKQCREMGLWCQLMIWYLPSPYTPQPNFTVLI